MSWQTLGSWTIIVGCINQIQTRQRKAWHPLTRGKTDLDLWPCDPKSIGFLSSSPTTYMWSWKWMNFNCSRYCAHKALYTECQNWPWPLTSWPKINRVPPLIIHNLNVKFESDWTKTVAYILATRSYRYTQSAKVDLDLWPCDLKSIGFLLSSSTNYIWSLNVIGLKL